MLDPTTSCRACLLKRKAEIPQHLLDRFFGFTHVSVKIYTRKINDKQRIYKKSARPHEGLIFVHLTDASDQMDEHPYFVVRFSQCSLSQFNALVEKIFGQTSILEKILNKESPKI